MLSKKISFFKKAFGICTKYENQILEILLQVLWLENASLRDNSFDQLRRCDIKCRIPHRDSRCSNTLTIRVGHLVFWTLFDDDLIARLDIGIDG